MTVLFEKLIFEQIYKIKRVVINAPEKAPKGRRDIADGKKASITTTIKPAPAFTPMMLGEAREFPVTACKRTPEQERPMPASAPARIRGRAMNKGWCFL